ESDGVSVRAIDVPMGAGRYPVRLIERQVEYGVNAILVDAPALFDRDGLYGDPGGGYGDNAFRFGLLGGAALGYARPPARGERAPSLRRARARLAGLVRLHLSADRPARRSVLPGHPKRPDDPQPRVPGTVRSGPAAVHRPEPRPLSSGAARVLGPRELAEGG